MEFVFSGNIDKREIRYNADTHDSSIQHSHNIKMASWVKGANRAGQASKQKKKKKKKKMVRNADKSL